MIALVESATGRLHALAADVSELAAPLPPGLVVVDVGPVDQRLQKWDQAGRRFVARVIVIRDLWAEMQADPDWSRIRADIRPKILQWFEVLRLNKGQRYKREETD